MSTTEITDDKTPMIISVGEYRKLKAERPLTVSHVDNMILANQLAEVLEWIPTINKMDVDQFQFQTKSWTVRVDMRGGSAEYRFDKRNG